MSVVLRSARPHELDAMIAEYGSRLVTEGDADRCPDYAFAAGMP